VSTHQYFRYIQRLSANGASHSEWFLIGSHENIAHTNGYGDYILVLTYKIAVLSIPEWLWSLIRKQNGMD
jgi:hypothetical protein